MYLFFFPKPCRSASAPVSREGKPSALLDLSMRSKAVKDAFAEGSILCGVPADPAHVLEDPRACSVAWSISDEWCEQGARELVW